jgi:Na+/proline symporter
MSYIDYFIIIAYLILTLIVGLWAGRNVKNMTDYAIGDRNFSTTTLVMTICATSISGSLVMSCAGETYKIGMIDMFASIGLVFDGLLIGFFIAPRIKSFLGLISVGEVMKEIYGQTAQYVTAISSVLVCIGFFAGQVKALSMFFSYFFDLHVTLATLMSCFIIIAYSSFGGIRSVTITDVLQLITLTATIPMVYNVVLNALGGYEELFKTIPETHTHILEHPSLTEYAILFLVFAFPGILPTTMQRMLMAKDIEQVQSSFKISALVLLPYIFFASMAGLVALSLNPGLPPSNAFMYLIDAYMPPVLKGMAIIGMIAVVMSTADSFVNAASVAFSHDLIKPLLGDRLTEKAELNIAKLFTLFSGLLAVVIALSFGSLLKLVLFAQGLYVPIISVPLLLGLFGFRSSQKTFLAGASSGALVFLIWKLYNLDNVFGFDSIVPAIIANTIILLSTHYLLKQPGGWGVKSKEHIILGKI